ncbi:MAG: Eco57I restriction-modification methylase domain-containing protein [Promethearchaeota archaeon]
MVLKKIDSKNCNVIGQIFTPNYIAKFMVKNILDYIESFRKKPHSLTVLEPSVGEGIFLRYLLDYGFSNITAYEIDINLKEVLLDSYPQINFKFENFLSSDPNEKFDIIIGNPPYLGQNYNAELFQDYVKKYPICDKYFSGNMDLFYYFIHLGIEKLNSGGILTFITTNYWITKSKKTGIKLLKPHVLEECYLLQYLDLSHLKLFDDAKGQHNCIFVLQKKTKQEKLQKLNKNIKVIQLFEGNDTNKKNESFNEQSFKELTNNNKVNHVKRYLSALTNNDLKKDESWNLIYPREVKIVVDKIENVCKIDGIISNLSNYFSIRNGMILIKDSIFILNERKNLTVKNNDFFIHINGKLLKLNEFEKTRLKKVYKSKSIEPFGYSHEEYVGYVIYFNKDEFKVKSVDKRNLLLKTKYPNLSEYILQFEKVLKEILINAKENPRDIYFPRRGSFIRQYNDINKENLIDLEPYYDKGEKLFFKFISKDNIFGYSNNSYYATSDTYFLWPKFMDDNLDILFLLAYLNSKLVNFLFIAKNISIKRSKTKLEQGLPVPHLTNFKNKKNEPTIELIKILTYSLVNKSGQNPNKNKEKTIERIIKSDYFSLIKNNELKEKVIIALKRNDSSSIKSSIDKLFFQLFDLNEDLINNLLKKYYNH